MHMVNNWPSKASRNNGQAEGSAPPLHFAVKGTCMQLISIRDIFRELVVLQFPDNFQDLKITTLFL